MKQLTRFGFTSANLLFSLFLGACSSLIPPQVIANPIGISGKNVQVEIGATGELSTASVGLGVIKSSFPDIDTSAIPIALNLSQSLFKVGFADESKLAASATSLPCNITLTRVDISITVKDDLHTYTLPTFQLNKVVLLEQQIENPNSYTIVTKDVFVGNVLSQGDAKQLQDIITAGGSNRAEVRVTVQATSVPELPPGSLLTLTFTTSEATLTF
jgi:hypothetical protein